MKRLILTLVLLLLARPALAQVVFDATSASASINGATSVSWSHTATGSNRYVRVCAGWAGSASSPPTSATYGGVSMVRIGGLTGSYSFGATGGTDLYELVAPASGSQTIQINFGDTTVGFGYALSYTGVDQVTPSGAPVSAASTLTAGKTADLTVSSAVNNIPTHCLSVDTGSGGVSAIGANHTGRQAAIDGSGYGAGIQDTAGAASVVFNWQTDGISAAAYVHMAADIIAGGGGGGGGGGGVAHRRIQ